MDRPFVLSKLLADRAIVDEPGDQDALGFGGTMTGAGPVGGGEDHGRAAARLGRVFRRGIAKIEAWTSQAAPLAAEENSPSAHLPRQLAGFLHFQTGTHGDTTGRQR